MLAALRSAHTRASCVSRKLFSGDFHIFLLTLLHRYLNILCVGMQRHHALGLTSEKGSKRLKFF